MAKLFFVISALLCLQLAACLDKTQKVTQQTPQQAAQKTPQQAAQQPLDFQELLKQAEIALGDLNEKFLNIVGVKNKDDLVLVVQEQSKKYAEKLQGLVEQLKTQTSKAGETVRQIAAKLDATVEELKINTEFSNVKKLQDEFQNRLLAVLKETEEFGTKLMDQGKGVSGEVEKVLKEIFDKTVETVNKVADDVGKIAQEKKA